MAFHRALGVLEKLVSFPSVSVTSNAAITEYIYDRLQALPLRLELLSYRDANDVEKVNLVATTNTTPSSATGGYVYCAHTDVVPADGWEYPHADAFTLHKTPDRLYGRGSCDMKGSLACFLGALETLPFDQLTAPVSLICTADEEIGYHGAKHVAENSEIYRQLVAQQPVAIIGEPTRLQIVHAHKGVGLFKAVSHGVAGHSSTTAGINANLKMIPFLHEMWLMEQELRTEANWQDDRFDPPIMSWNIGINDFTYASNITPERSVCTVGFRPMPDQPFEQLIERARKKADELGLEFIVQHSAASVFVDPDSAHIRQLLELAGHPASQTVGYGTDAAMLTELKRLAICGPGDIAQAHTVDEWIALEQMQAGVEWNQKLIKQFCMA